MALALDESVSLVTDWTVRNPSLRAATVKGVAARYLWGVNLLADRAVWVVPFLTALGAFAATSLVYWVAPETHGHGTDSAIDAIHADPKGMRTRTWPVKLIASALTLGTGGSGGTEGPTAQMSAAATSVLARWLKLNESQAKVAVAAGLAAGVGAIFRAPVGGAILGAELLYVNGFDFSALFPSVIASGVAYLELAAAVGFSPLFGRYAWLGLPLSPRAAAFPILGICAGLLARLYCKGFYTVAGWFERLKRNRGRLDLRPFRAAAAGLIVGLIGLFVPGVLGTGYALGYGTIQRVLSADAILALPLALLILMPFAKLLATSLTVGSGGSGGVFGPGMVIGATAGAALWRLAEPHGLAPASPASLVIVGMAACLGAASHAPVAITVIAAETCGSVSVLEPAFIAVPIAVLVAGRPTLYASQRIKRKAGVRGSGGLPAELRAGVLVRDARKAGGGTGGDDHQPGGEEKQAESVHRARSDHSATYIVTPSMLARAVAAPGSSDKTPRPGSPTVGLNRRLSGLHERQRPRVQDLRGKESKVAETMNEAATLGLTPEQVESFKENGFIGPFDLYSEEEAPLLWNQAMIEMVKSKNKPHNSTTINYDRHLDCETLSRHIAEPAIVHKLNSLMGDDVICWKTHVFHKAPGEARTDWHQVESHFVYESADLAYPSLHYTEEATMVTQELTVWTAFSPADKEHACLRFIPGSHKQWYYDETKPMARNVETKADTFFGYNYSELRLDKDWDPNEQEITDMEMKAGQFVLFLAKCVHSSYPNTSDTKRLGFAGRYVHPSVRVYGDIESLSGYGGSMDLDKHANVLVSGEDNYGHNRLYETNLNGFPFPKVQTNGR